VTDPNPAFPLTERIEQAGVLLTARLAELPLMRAAASCSLRTQIALARSRTAFWHALGVPTRDDVNRLREHLALVRYRVETVRRERGA
jgi:hypothetical protein